MIRLGIIGLGRMGGYHAAIALNLPNIQLTALVDPSPETWSKISSDRPITRTKNYTEILNLVDAVIIATPTQTHFEIAQFFLSHHKDVLIEKPITPTRHEAEQLFDLAKKNQCVLHVGHVERFNGALLELKKVIDRPYLIEAHRMGPFSPRVKGDSVVLDLMIHDIDLILGLVDSPVAHIGTLGHNWETELSDIALVHIKFEDGTLANIIANRTAHIRKRTMQIHQEKSFLNLDLGSQDISVHTQSHNKEQVDQLVVPKGNPLKQEILYFLDAIRTNTNQLNDQQDLAALDLTLKIVKSCHATH